MRRGERSLVAVARKCAACVKKQPTALLWRIGSTKERSGTPGTSLDLHVVGVPSPVAEVLLILLTDRIAQHAGVEKRAIALNSIGSADSSGRYMRDIGGFLRKHLESISPTLRGRAATDPFGTLVQLIDRGHPIVSRAPQSMEYLTEEERKRFWELLEYLEVLRLPYELHAQILGSRDCWSHTLFEVATTDTETGARLPFAYGGRYDPLISWVSGVPSSAVRVSIECETRGRTRLDRVVSDVPAIYFLHLGREARRKVFDVLELLREADIPVHQSLLYERLGEQMEAARTFGVPYMLIMGHKEATEGNIMVREVATNAQDTVPVNELVGYLKRRRVQNWKPIAV